MFHPGKIYTSSPSTGTFPVGQLVGSLHSIEVELVTFVSLIPSKTISKQLPTHLTPSRVILNSLYKSDEFLPLTPR
jgi:hypothetical protein